jgi:hypothetical protein
LAGKSRGPGHRVKDLDALLAKLFEDTLAGRVERGVAAVATQIIYGRTRLIAVERRISETEAYEQRIEALEAAIQQRQRGGRRL